MKLHLIRHGRTEANEKKLYCGHTDLPLSVGGRQELESLKVKVHYPPADLYIVSGLARTTQTLDLIYGKQDYIVLSEFMEMNFGAFEMKSYEDLKQDSEYLRWIGDIANESCPGGEGEKQFASRVLLGLDRVMEACLSQKADSAAVITHGGAIVQLMQRFFPGQRNFYEWQPGFGRGYTIVTDDQKAEYEII